jgi:periplasmic protein TonB
MTFSATDMSTRHLLVKRGASLRAATVSLTLHVALAFALVGGARRVAEREQRPVPPVQLVVLDAVAPMAAGVSLIAGSGTAFPSHDPPRTRPAPKRPPKGEGGAGPLVPAAAPTANQATMEVDEVVSEGVPGPIGPAAGDPKGQETIGDGAGVHQGAPGSGLGNAAVGGKLDQGDWESIRAATCKHLRYPPLARRMGWTGQVVLRFRLGQTGAVAAESIATSSGYTVLDESALDALKRAAPFPLRGRDAEVIMPIVFALR